VTLLLAVDTATSRCSVALGDEHGVLASSSVAGDRRHVEALVPAILAACRAAGVTLDDLDALAVDVGPGLFTGMRVGIATVQGLAVGLGLVVHPVCSLDVLAHPLRHTDRPVAAVIDARRGEVFRNLYRVGVEPGAATCCAPVALAEELGGPGEWEIPGRWLVVGDGAVRYRAEFEAVVPGAEVVDAVPSAASVLALALAARAGGDPGIDPGALEALYLRSPDARANFTVLRSGAAAPGATPSPGRPLDPRFSQAGF